MDKTSVVKVYGLKKYFDLRGNFLETLFSKKENFLKAVDGINLDIKKGEVFGLVGESGCGKTTTARLIMGLIKPSGGKVYIESVDLFGIKDKIIKKQLTFKMTMIPQDPYEHLSPWLTVEKALVEPLRIHNIFSNKYEELDRVVEIMEIVDLTPVKMLLPKYPYELSGGQRQRVVIARALILNPELIIADEPVSMIDMSIRAGIINLLLELRKKYSLTLILITHDIAIARHMCDRIAVMYLGKIVEKGSVDNIIDNSLHPYTKALISAVPIPDPEIMTGEIPIKGRIPSPTEIPFGCRFNTRCISAEDLCRREEPELLEVGKNHFVACHLHVDIHS